MKVWAVEAGEHNEGVEIAAEYGGDRRPLVFADTDEGYAAAFKAFKALVVQRIGAGPAYTFPGDFDIMARTEVTATGGGDAYDYTDVVRLRAYDVLAG